MSNRYDEMTLFLKYAYEQKIKNLDSFNEIDIYRLLQSYDIDENPNPSKKEEDYFNYFITYFSHDKKEKVYVHPSQPGFLQVNNSDELSDMNYIKIYINPSRKGYCDVAFKLISFLAKHPEIEHRSKISEDVRSDRIVLRVKNIDDVKTIYDYIYNEPSIINNIKRSNPFLMHYGAVGFAFDKLLSFNAFISHYIYEYITGNRDINSINADDFKDYLRHQYDEILYAGFKKDDKGQDIKDAIDFSKQVTFDEYANFVNSDLFARNYKTLKSAKPSITYNEAIFEHLIMFEEFFYLYNQDNFDYLNNLYDYSKTDKYASSRKDSLEEKYGLYKAKDAIDSYIKYSYAQEKDIEAISYVLLTYATLRPTNPNEAIRWITKKNGFRDMFVNISSSQVFRIVGADMYKYVEDVIRGTYISDYDTSTRAAS